MLVLMLMLTLMLVLMLMFVLVLVLMFMFLRTRGVDPWIRGPVDVVLVLSVLARLTYVLACVCLVTDAR
eukprot:4748057-Lingulodinium_polyedra.AAC.1